jgi:hypothetical protein
MLRQFRLILMREYGLDSVKPYHCQRFPTLYAIALAIGIARNVGFARGARFKLVPRNSCLWALETFSLRHIESRACNEPEDNVLGHVSSFLEREPPDSSWRKLPPI